MINCEKTLYNRQERLKHPGCRGNIKIIFSYLKGKNYGGDEEIVCFFSEPRTEKEYQ
jgi:hypothetical protein